LLAAAFVLAVALSGWGGQLFLALTFTALGSLLLLGGAAFHLQRQRRDEERHNASLAAALVARLTDADVAQVPGIVAEIQDYRRWADPLLKEAYDGAEREKDSRKQLHASLALLPVDPGQVEYLYGRLLNAEPAEVGVIRDALRPYKGQLLGRLWAEVEQPPRGHGGRVLRGACALASYDPDGPRWGRAAGPVAEQLVSVNPAFLERWMSALRPVRAALVGPLCGVFRDRREENAARRNLAASILTDYAADRPDVLADLMLDADEGQFAILFPKAEAHRDQAVPVLHETLAVALESQATDEGKERLAKRQANAGVALLKLGRPEAVWPHFRHRPDPGCAVTSFTASVRWGPTPEPS
jgi:hypothetical protein